MIKSYCCFRNHLLLFRLIVLAGHWIMQLRFFPPLRGEQHLNSSSVSLSYQSPSVSLHINLHNGTLCLFILCDCRWTQSLSPELSHCSNGVWAHAGKGRFGRWQRFVTWSFCTFSLLQAVKQLLELPLNLAVVSPAHTPNWDLVSDVVNSCSRVYRSPKQCRNRYENVIIPREEGKVSSRRKMRLVFALSCRVFFPYLHKHLFFC